MKTADDKIFVGVLLVIGGACLAYAFIPKFEKLVDNFLERAPKTKAAKAVVAGIDGVHRLLGLNGIVDSDYTPQP